MDLLLGIDLGTSGVKVALFDAANGSCLVSSTEEYPLLHPQPSWAEQDPETWWTATVQAIRNCLEEAATKGIASSSIKGAGISGQMHGAVLLDEQDQPLRPAILWCDTRTEVECAEMTEQVGAQRLIDLVSNPALPGFTAPKLLWVRKHEPEIWAKVRRVLLPKDYLRFRMTGTSLMEISDAAGTCLLDVIHGQWSTETMEILGLDPLLFPPIIGAADIAGTITPAVAEATGLPVGLPIAGGGADNACAAVGAGIGAPGQALVSIGTSGVVLAFSATPQVDRSGPVPRAHTFNHAVPSAWYLMGVTQGAGLSLRWVRDQLGAEERMEMQASGRDIYDILADEAGTIPAGSEGLIFLPYLQGERTPILDSQARGGWIGLTARHTRAHMIRAVLEGVAYSLRDCLEVIRASGVTIDQIRVTGGGARSPVWRQILADVFAQPLAPLVVEEGPSLGAALLAGVAAGVYPSVPDACAQIVRTITPVEPNPEASEIYKRGYGLYQRLYPALRDIMHELG
jgi:xylulokinase